MLPGGYVGVDVFFVVSGYVISGLLHREIKSTGRLDFTRFYARRLRRLLPAAIFVLSVTMAVFWLIYSPTERQRLASAGLATALYSSNAWFALYSTDYLAGDASSNPLLHTWSLAVEEQFYVLWPFLLWIFATRARAKSRDASLLVGVTVASVASFAAGVVLTRISLPWAFFGSPTRAWEFGVGAIAYLVGRQTRMPNLRTRTLVSGIGILVIIASAATLNAESRMPGFVALFPVGGTALVILGGTGGDSIFTRAISSRPMVWLGDLSYGWYLWHWPLLVAVREVTNPSDVMWAVPVAIVASLILAWAMYHAFENPIRRNRYLTWHPRMAATAALLLTGISASVLYAEREQARVQASEPAQVAFTRARDDRPWILSSDGCHASITQVSIPEHCDFGKADGAATIVLFGDSHAEQWFPALQRVAIDAGVRLVSFTKSGCPSVWVEPYLAAYRRYYHECVEWRELALARIRQLKPQLVVIANSYAYEKFRSVAPNVASDSWANGVDLTLDKLKTIGASALLLRDTPRPGFDVPVCLARAASADARRKDACSFAIGTPDDARFLTEREAAARFDDTVVDVYPMICPANVCAAVHEGVVKFADTNHLTATYSAMLAQQLSLHIRPMLALTAVPAGANGPSPGARR